MHQATRAKKTPERYLDKRLAERLTTFLGECVSHEPAHILKARLRQWQWVKLVQTLDHAANNTSHYREVFADFLWQGSSIAHLSAQHSTTNAPYGNIVDALVSLVQSLPFTHPQQLAHHPEAFLAVSHTDVHGVISLPTSGTTGAGKRIFCTHDDLAQTIDFFQHGMQFLVSPHAQDHVVLLMSDEREGSVGHLLQQAMQQLGVVCTVLGFPVDEDATMNALCSLQPTCLVGVPSHLLALSRHNSARLIKKNLRTVLLSGDIATKELRASLEKALSCKVFFHYGLTETGLGGAVECPKRMGCHIREADLLTEIVTPNGHPVPVGQWGEITLTTLTRQAMPLIRYRTGDMGRLIAEACPCGSALQRLEVRGRMQDIIALPNATLLHCADIDAYLHPLPWLRSYQPIVYHQKGVPVSLELRVQLTPCAPPEAHATLSKIIHIIPGLAVSNLALLGLASTGKGVYLPVDVTVDSNEANNSHSATLSAKRHIIRVEKEYAK